jgi:twinkle protein
MNLLPDDIDFDRYLTADGDRERIRPLADFSSAVTERLATDPNETGEHLPWRKTRSHFAFRPGEITIWSGIGGSGKSTLLSMTLAFMPEGTKSVIASLEMPPVTTIAKITRQCSGKAHPDPEACAEIYRGLSGMYVYDQVDTVPADRVIAMMAYAARELGIKHCAIDSLVKLGVAEDDYDGQKRVVDKLAQVAKWLGIHVHLVCHLRKSGSIDNRPDGFSIRGSSAIRDLVDNVLILHRNYAKERAVLEGEPVEKDAPDAELIVDKNRHGEWTGHYRLWWHGPSQQYLEEPLLWPMSWK